MRPPPGVIEALWLSADSKGFYTKLDSPSRSSLASLGVETLAPRAAGFCRGPILDSGTSPHFRFDCPDATAWAMHLVSSGRLGAFVIYLPSGAAC